MAPGRCVGHAPAATRRRNCAGLTFVIHRRRSRAVGALERHALVMPKANVLRSSTLFRRIAKLLARRLRALREERGWSLREAAARVPVGVAVLRRIEAGRGNPSLAVMVSLARAYGQDIAELVRSLKISSRSLHRQSLRPSGGITRRRNLQDPSSS